MTKLATSLLRNRLPLITVILAAMTISFSTLAMGADCDNSHPRELSQLEKRYLQSLTVTSQTNDNLRLELVMPYDGILAVDNIVTSVEIPLPLSESFSVNAGGLVVAVKIMPKGSMVTISHTTTRKSTGKKYKTIQINREYSVSVTASTMSSIPSFKMINAQFTKFPI